MITLTISNCILAFILNVLKSLFQAVVSASHAVLEGTSSTMQLPSHEETASSPTTSTAALLPGGEPPRLERTPGAYRYMLPSVLLTNLPFEFTGSSTQALFPFYTPEAIKEILNNNKVSSKYTFERPASKSPYMAIQI